jgi:type VI secretion system protein ImpK
MSATDALNTSSLPVAFRDTALTVTMLSQKASTLSVAQLRERCQLQVRTLRDALRADGQPEDVVKDAAYAQCALLDEAALSHLTSADRDAWERQPLQVVEFGTHDAGEVLIAHMQRRVREPQPVRPVLAVFLAVLGLGFQGRFALEGPDARTTMMRALSERLGEPEASSGGVIVRSGAQRRRWARVTLPMGVFLAVGTAAVMWMVLDRWLSTAAAQLLH